MRRFRTARHLIALGLVLVVPPLAQGAEVQLRESVLQGLRDRVTATITGTVDRLGTRAHRLEEDCDLHVPLRSQDIRVPLLAEVKNAWSEPPGQPRTFWSQQIAQAVGTQAVHATGAFRIRLEHPPSGVQSEADPLPPYPHSNPDHQVELHPLLRLGPLDFTGHVKWIQEGEWFFQGYGPEELRPLLQRRLRIQRITVSGEGYLRLRGTRVGFNHWDLRARVVQAPQPLPDGALLRLDIFDDNHVVPGAVGLPAVTIAGTTAHTKAQTLASGAFIAFQALIRLHLPTILDQADNTERQIRLPLKFVLLDLEAE